jgi:hypothetical protein
MAISDAVTIAATNKPAPSPIPLVVLIPIASFEENNAVGSLTIKFVFLITFQLRESTISLTRGFRSATQLERFRIGTIASRKHRIVREFDAVGQTSGSKKQFLLHRVAGRRSLPESLLYLRSASLSSAA